MPGYILGLGVSVMLALPTKIVYEGITRVVIPLIRGIWNQLISPFFQGLGNAFTKSLLGLFSEKKSEAGLEGLKFIEGHNTFQKLIFSLGALAGLVAAAPFSIVALAWHSAIGLFEALAWGSSKIWEGEYGKKNFFDKDTQFLNRYSGQRILAAPGYALGLIVCIPVGADFGMDSAVESALKRITDEFKCEERSPQKPSDFFARRRHMEIINSMLEERGNNSEDVKELNELKVALDQVLDGNAGNRGGMQRGN